MIHPGRVAAFGAPAALALAALGAGVAAGRGPLGSEQRLSVVRAVAPPSYPAVAAQARTGGTVNVEVMVGPGGDVIESQLGEIEGPPRVFKQDWYALLAREWQFKPSEGVAQPRKATIQFVFRLMPRGTAREKLGTVFIPPYRVEVREEEPEQVKLSGH